MRADPVTYQRATNVSLFGLGLQIVFALAMLVYAFFGRDPAAANAFLFVALGVPVWIGLALVFHQHRLERLEAIEADLYASSSAAQASVFEDMEDELRVAARRLAWMHNFLLPTLSVLVGLALIGVGVWQLQAGALVPELSGHAGWAVSVGLSVAVISFVFARFAAGMAKQEVWSNLRAGAAYMIGNALVGLALGVVHAIARGAPGPIETLTNAIAIYEIVIGVEVLLNFLLNIYRPRKAGEVPRPAFDSRILGFFAAPDKIVESISDAVDYQFGLNISSTWFYQLISRSLLSLLLLSALIMWGLTSIAVVGPHESGLVLRNGRLTDVVGPGPHLKMPWPFGEVRTYPASSSTELLVGSEPPEEEGGILWTTPRTGSDIFFFVQPTPVDPSVGGAPTRDFALVGLELAIQYRVTDLEAYQRLAVDAGPDAESPDVVRQRLLRAIALRELTRAASQYAVDEVLGEKRDELSSLLRERIESAYADLNPEVDPETGEPRGAGVEVLFCGIIGAHPPEQEEVAREFQLVVAAQQEERAAIERAEAEATRELASVAGDADLARQIVAELDALEALMDAGSTEAEVSEQELLIETLLSEAGGEAASTIARAKADRWRRHMEARATAARHEGRTLLFRAAPRVYTASLYLDALAEAAQNARVYISALDDLNLQFNDEQLQTTLRGFEPKTATEE